MSNNLMARVRRWPEWVMPLLLAAIGAAWRLIWLARQSGDLRTLGEAPNVAISFARHGTFADPYGPGTGPTAHVNIILPFVDGLVYRALGVETPAALWTLSLMSVAMVLGAGLLAYAAFRRIGMPRGAALTAFGIFCLAPLSPQMETIAFRVWEGGLAVLLYMLLLWLVVRAEDAGASSWRRLLLAGAVAAVLFFVNPPLGLAGHAALAWLTIRRIAVRRWPRAGIAFAVTLLAFMAPWAWRNHVELGAFVPLRSNFGLEFALANNAAAVAAPDSDATFRARFREIHPINSPAAFQEVRRIGEVAYAKRLGDETKAWVRAHPGDFARLTWRHWREYYFPPAAEFAAGDLRWQLSLVLAALGLLGAVAAAVLWRGRWVYTAIGVLMPVLPYLVVHPNARYRYLIKLGLIFLAVEFVRRAFGALRRRAV